MCLGIIGVITGVTGDLAVIDTGQATLTASLLTARKPCPARPCSSIPASY